MHCLISSTHREEFAQSHTVLSPFCSKPDHMGGRSELARADRRKVCLSAKSAPHSLTGCFAAVTGIDDSLGQDESKASQDGWYLPPPIRRGRAKEEYSGQEKKSKSRHEEYPHMKRPMWGWSRRHLTC